MFGSLLCRIFPNYETRAMLKECRDDWRADAWNLSKQVQAAREQIPKLEDELKAVRLEVVRLKALAETRDEEIEYLRGLAETMAETIAKLRAAAREKM